MVFHEMRWNDLLESLINFRKELRDSKGLKLREEIHAEKFINRPGPLKRIPRNDRLDILKKCLDWAANEPDLNIITVRVDKVRVDKERVISDVFEKAWAVFIQRFENTLSNHNFRGPSNPDDKGFIISDNTDGKKLTALIRKMRRYNPIPNWGAMFEGGYRDIPLRNIVEDPFFKDSAHSFFHQIVDVVSYSARQIYETNNYMRKKGGRNFYKRLLPVLVTQASRSNEYGIVEI